MTGSINFADSVQEEVTPEEVKEEITGYLHDALKNADLALETARQACGEADPRTKSLLMAWAACDTAVQECGK